MTSALPIRLLDRLPEPLRIELAALERDAVTLLGELREIQTIVDRNLPTIERLIDGGLAYVHLTELLAEIGIARPNGRPFSRSTLSSAVSRARQRASPRERRHDAAGRRSAPLDDAAHRSMRLSAASSRPLPDPAAARCDARRESYGEAEEPQTVPRLPTTEPPLLGTASSSQSFLAPGSRSRMHPANDPLDNPADRTKRAASLLIMYGDHNDQ